MADLLDGIGAQDLDHRTMAREIGSQWPDLGGWWVQTVTVGYERIRGVRKVGQVCAGTFQASKSKTFPVPIATLYAAFADGQRAGWMGGPSELRTATENRSVRLTWPDGTVVSAWFTDKGAEKSAVAIQHEKLPTNERREAEKERWAERFSALQTLLR